MSAYPPCMEIEDSSCLDEDEVVTRYFYQGYTNLETVAFINDVHNWNISLSTPKKLRKMNFKRSIETVAIGEDLQEVLLKELAGSGSFVSLRGSTPPLVQCFSIIFCKSPHVKKKYFAPPIRYK